MTALNRSVLIADGDPDQRDWVTRSLQSIGYPCQTVGDGRQALNLLQAGGQDLLVTDVLLPELHGHALIVAALQLERPPRIIVRSDMVHGRIVRDLLARGISDYLHKSTPHDLFVTKVRSAFELASWQSGLQSAQANTMAHSESGRLSLLERQLQLLSIHFTQALSGLRDQENYCSEVPQGLLNYVKRLDIETPHQKSQEMIKWANTRAAPRIVVKTIATAIPVDDLFMPIDLPTKLMLMDLSMGGARLIHTRSITTSDMVLTWRAATIPDYDFYLPLTITRCRSGGRFYDIGGQFDVPMHVASQMKALAGEAMTATS